MPSGWYVLVKRFLAKEERRRIVAAVCDPSCIPARHVAFDNKLNVLHRDRGSLPEALAKGLTLFLNSTAIDLHFRQFSGHTQVNARDLRSFRFPEAAALERLGEKVTNSMSRQRESDRLVEREAPMPGGIDPVAAKRSVQEALDALKRLQAPKSQINERSALTLLGLLNLWPGAAWGDAANSLRGVTEIMGWMSDHYGKTYAPNTRETIRRYTLHQFMEMGLVDLNPDDTSRPTNSPNTVYRIEASALGLLRRFGKENWDGMLEA